MAEYIMVKISFASILLFVQILNKFMVGSLNRHPSFIKYRNRIITSCAFSTNHESGIRRSLKLKKSDNDQKIIQDMLYRIRKCNEKQQNVKLLNFIVDNEIVGKVTKPVAELLRSAHTPPIFKLGNRDNKKDDQFLTLTSESGTNCESRSDAIMHVMRTLHSQGIIQGWRDELYPACINFHSQPKFLVERAAAPFLGIQQYGVHLNGIVVEGSNNVQHPGYNSSSIRMWLARRSPTKSKYPGMLDHIVAGGQPYNLTIMDNLIKECEEEAGIPSDIAAQCQPAGAINYQTIDSIETEGNHNVLHIVSRSVLFCYDLVLPLDFLPKVVDGEVQEFFTWNLDQVAQSMNPDFADPIKPNCYLVIIDFLLRMGYISPDTEGYLEVLRGLRNEKCT